ncbi:MAG: phage integrase N-terminal SAM-like domain-containing protein [Candidatus Kuenenia sp.]|nr:phage integrase N-terminal SAM-like domain-containing protein [Candidatus Kuenenia sp.]
MDKNKTQRKTSDTKPKLLDVMQDKIRLKHYSIRTEQSYMQWVKRFIIYHNKRHPKDMGEKEITEFLTHLLSGKMFLHLRRIRHCVRFYFCTVRYCSRMLVGWMI